MKMKKKTGYIIVEKFYKIDIAHTSVMADFRIPVMLRGKQVRFYDDVSIILTKKQLEDYLPKDLQERFELISDKNYNQKDMYFSPKQISQVTTDIKSITISYPELNKEFTFTEEQIKSFKQSIDYCTETWTQKLIAEIGLIFKDIISNIEEDSFECYDDKIKHIGQSVANKIVIKYGYCMVGFMPTAETVEPLADIYPPLREIYGRPLLFEERIPIFMTIIDGYKDAMYYFDVPLLLEFLGRNPNESSEN